jgi:hypothetical protein
MFDDFETLYMPNTKTHLPPEAGAEHSAAETVGGQVQCRVRPDLSMGKGPGASTVDVLRLGPRC